MKLPEKILEPRFNIWFSNLSIVTGVLLFQWDIFYIMFLFWFESVSIGFFHFFKIFFNNFKPTQDELKIPGYSEKFHKRFLAFFFAVHYNGFNAGHLVFLVIFSMLFQDMTQSENIPIETWLGFGFHAEPGLKNKMEFMMRVLIFPIIFFNHFISYKRYLNERKEFKITDVNPSEMMFSPYKRILTMHITIVLGGAISIFTMSIFPNLEVVGLGITVIFVLFKAYQDLVAESFTGSINKD